MSNSSVGSRLRRNNCSDNTPFDRMPNNPKVSVVITLYTTNQITYFKKCLEGLVNQTYENAEFCIYPENEEVITQVEEICDSYDDDRIVVHSLDSVSGLSEARNIGAEKATGDIVAFLDVDAVPKSTWVQKLVAPYVRYDLFAVGGRAIPVWEGRDTRPPWVPEEFDWLIGSNHEEFGSKGDFVRNTYGCNISFRRDVFLDLGGYDTDLGKSHGFNLQGEEPSFGIKLQQEYDTAVYYQPDALIEHYVDEEQQTLSWLIERAFLQGVSKEVIDSKFADTETPLDEEDDYLKFILLSAAPSYLIKMITELQPRNFLFAVMIFIYTACVGSGFLYSKIS